MEKQFKKTHIYAYYAARGPARPGSAPPVKVQVAFPN